MILFNLKRLEIKLINGEVSEKAGFQYLLTFTIFLAIASYLPEETFYSDEWWEMANFVLGLVITTLAIKKTFTVNRNGQNKEFLKRFLSLAFVIGLRVAVLAMLLILAYKIIMFIIPLTYYEFINELWVENISNLVLSLVGKLIFFLLLIRSFKRINQNKNMVHERNL